MLSEQMVSLLAGATSAFGGQVARLLAGGNSASVLARALSSEIEPYCGNSEGSVAPIPPGAALTDGRGQF